MSGSVKRPVAAYKVSGELIAEYPSVGDAARDLGLKPSYIFNVLNGRCLQTKNMKFRYLDERPLTYYELKLKIQSLEEENSKLLEIVHSLTKQLYK